MNLQSIDGGKADLKEVECAGGVIVLGRGLVVLVRPLNGQDEWLLPKGHVEEGESSMEAAIREAREETGAVCIIEPSSPEPLKVTHYIDQARKESKTTTWWLLRAAALKSELSETVAYNDLAGPVHRNIGIFPSVVAITRLTYEEHREVLCGVLGGQVE